MDESILEHEVLIPSVFIDFLIELSESRTLIFDLDNTIYNERKFLFTAYQNVSKQLAKNYACSEEDTFNFLISTFNLSGRYKVFDKLQGHLKIKDQMFLSTCLTVLRTTVVFPKIDPYIYFIKYLKARKSDPIIIITNGNPEQQKNKVKSINWRTGKLKVIYSNLHMPKPSPESFFYLKEEYLLKRPIYIGDSPDDLFFAKNCGIDFINIWNQEITLNTALNNE
jgi:putative hydrolase of the HAD superfamily